MDGQFEEETNEPITIVVDRVWGKSMELMAPDVHYHQGRGNSSDQLVMVVGTTTYRPRSRSDSAKGRAAMMLTIPITLLIYHFPGDFQ